MNKEKILLLTILLGILLLLFLTNFQRPITQGKIIQISEDNSKIKIKIQNKTEDIILFKEHPFQKINLQKNQIIKIEGKKENWKNKNQIIASKVYLLFLPQAATPKSIR